jgi:toxin-antitoxin system PIN domain toxin
MILLDVNVLVYAHREDASDHKQYRAFLEDAINGREAFGVADIVLSGYLRVVTHPRVFVKPTPLASALNFVESIRTAVNCVVIAPGPRHWGIFADLCRHVAVRGNLVPDAFLAALSIETGSEWITTDRGFARFPGLRWRHPLSL